MNIEKEMSVMEIQMMKDQMLKNNTKEDWVIEIVKLPEQIEALEQQFWAMGKQIVHARKILYVAKLIGEEDE